MPTPGTFSMIDRVVIISNELRFSIYIPNLNGPLTSCAVVACRESGGVGYSSTRVDGSIKDSSGLPLFISK